MNMRPGGGGRFKAIEDKAKEEGHSEESAKKIAASAGIAKYGEKKMSAMATRGKLRAEKKFGHKA
jgi:hypothetical protein